MAITNGYCTLNEVKAALRITDATDDTLIEGAIEGASRRIDGYTGRFFYQKSAAIKMYARDIYTLLLQDDLYQITTLKTDDDGDGTYEDTWTLNVDYQLQPLNATLQNRPYNRLTAIGGKTFPIVIQPEIPAVEVTGIWGWGAIPDDVNQACILLAMRGFARYNAALGVVGFADMAIQVRSVDPDVRDMLSPYVRYGIA
jgi:hypothetical protein